MPVVPLALGWWRVWDVNTGQQTLTLKGHTGGVMSAVFSPDGSRLASASADQTVKVWGAFASQEAQTFKGLADWVLCLAISPDGARLALGSGDGSVAILDATTWQKVLAFPAHNGQLRGVAFSPDGKRLASSSHLVCVCWSACPRWRRVLSWGVVIAICVSVYVSCESLAVRWHEGFAEFYDSYFGTSFVTDITTRDWRGLNICVCDYTYYPYFGSRRQFTVCRPLWVPHHAEFLSYIRDHHVNIVVTRETDAIQMRYECVASCIRDYPEAFLRVQSRGGYLVCEVHQEALPHNSHTRADNMQYECP